MKTKLSILFFCLAALAMAQWTASPSTSYPALDSWLSARLAFQAGSGAPSTCVAGKEIDADLTNGVVYWCVAANTPVRIIDAAALAAWTGSANLTTLGTITTGTWHGTAIGDSYIASAATWNAKQPAISGAPNTWPTLGTAAAHAAGDFEPALGNPATSGYILSSTNAGVRSWIAPPSGGSMTWPSAGGIAVYGGSSAWGSSLGLATSVGSPGADTNVPTEKAVATALAAKQAALTNYSTISGLTGYPSTFPPTNSGNWAGTWQTYSPSYFQAAISGAPSTWPTTWAWGSLSGVPSTFAPPAPGASTLGGVNSKDCTGTGHVQKINTDGSVGCSADSGGAVPTRVLIPGQAAVCQGVAAASGSLPATNAATATCEADNLSAYLSFANNSGSGQGFYQRVDLPQDWAGTLKLNVAAWSTSTSAATINVSTGCVGSAGVTSGIALNTAQSLTFTPGASSYRTVLAAQSLTTTGCAAGRELVVRYVIVGAAAAPLNVRSLQITE